jgi:hypothetical protein
MAIYVPREPVQFVIQVGNDAVNPDGGRASGEGTPVAQQAAEADGAQGVGGKHPGQQPEVKVVPEAVYVLREPGMPIGQSGDAVVKVDGRLIGAGRVVHVAVHLFLSFRSYKAKETAWCGRSPFVVIL